MTMRVNYNRLQNVVIWNFCVKYMNIFIIVQDTISIRLQVSTYISKPESFFLFDLGSILKLIWKFVRGVFYRQCGVRIVSEHVLA